MFMAMAPFCDAISCVSAPCFQGLGSTKFVVLHTLQSTRALLP